MDWEPAGVEEERKTYRILVRELLENVHLEDLE
jgi:hypothetical protein